MFPVSILVATIAMASGIGGAIFFSPIFMLVLKLDPAVAVGTALITELFGFSSGVYAYRKARLIDYRLGKSLLAFSVPTAIVGAFMTQFIPAVALKAIFATGIIFIGSQIFMSWRKEEKEKNAGITDHVGAEDYDTEIVDSSGKVYHYKICNKNQGRMFAGVGGFFVGMISVGLGELTEFHLLSRCRLPAPVTVATAVFITVITVLIASLGHFYEFAFKSPPEVLTQVKSIVIFTIPGVLIGGQIGPRVQKILPEDYTKVGLSILFVFVGALMIFTLTQ